MARGLKGIKKPHPLGSVPTRSGVSPLTVVASADSAASSGHGVKISELPAASVANDTDQLEVNQGGTSRRVTVGQITVATVGGTVNVRAFGALGDDAHDDYPAIQAAIDYVKASPGYGSIYIPAGVYQLQTGEILLDADNLHLIISPGATLKQMTYGWSTVQVRGADGCSVGGGGRILNPVTKTQILGTYEGMPARERSCGVWCFDTSDTTVYDLVFDNMVVDVEFRPLDATVERDENNSMRDCISWRHDFGLLAGAQRNLVVHNLRGYTTMFSQQPVSPPPPHLIYMTLTDEPNLKSENVVFSDVVDYDNAFSSSIKIKWTSGVSLVNCISRKCARGFDLNCDHLTLVGAQVYELVDIGDSQQAGIVFEDCSFVEAINPIVIVPDGASAIECIVVRVACTDITIRGGYLSSNRPGLTTGLIRMNGTRNKVIDTILEERGVSNPLLTFETATDCALIRPHIKNAAGTRIATVDAAAVNSRIILNQDLCSFDFVVPTSVTDNGTGTRLSFEGRPPRAASSALPTTTTYQDAAVIVSNSAVGKNPARSYNRVWYYPDGTTVAANGESTGWQAALVAAGGTVSAPRLAIIQTFIDAEKTSGAWYLTDDYWVLWGENATQSLFSLKQRRMATVGGGAPTFTADRGYVFNGTTDYLNTGFILNQHLVAMTATDARIAVYERTLTGSGTSRAGVFETSQRAITMVSRTAGNLMQFQLNCTATSVANTSSLGLQSAGRAVGNVYACYNRGVALAAPVVTTSNTVMPSLAMYIGTNNSPSGPGPAYMACSLGFVAIGASLTAAQELAQYNAVQAWATSIGANV